MKLRKFLPHFHVGSIVVKELVPYRWIMRERGTLSALFKSFFFSCSFLLEYREILFFFGLLSMLTPSGHPFEVILITPVALQE